MPARNLNHGSLVIADGAGHTLTIPVQEGNLSFEEKQEPHIVLNRGVLYEWTKGQEVPCAIDFDITFERWSAKSGGGATPTVMDAMMGRGGASTWTSTLPNKLNSPFGVDLKFTLADVEGSGGGQNEVLTFTKTVRASFKFTEHPDADRVKVSCMALLVTPTVTQTATP